MWKELEEFGITNDEMTTQEKLNTLIGDRHAESEHYAMMMKIVMKYIEKAMKYRKMREGVKTRCLAHT